MNKMEFALLVVYCIFAFIWFLAIEINTYIEVIKKNKSQKFFKYTANHCKIIIRSIFFPVDGIMILIKILAVSIVEMSENRKGK